MLRLTMEGAIGAGVNDLILWKHNRIGEGDFGILLECDDFGPVAFCNVQVATFSSLLYTSVCADAPSSYAQLEVTFGSGIRTEILDP